jgi:Protein of unknown function (DUF3455)
MRRLILKEIAMHYRSIKSIVGLFAVIGVFCFAVKPMPATTFDNNNGPELPAGCDSIQVPEGNKLAFHAYARGAQVYKWNGATWDFVAPVATLYAESDYFGEVGTHYVGPQWESKSGSKVKAARVPDTGCVPDSSAIAWLLLKKTQTTGNGIFTKVTYVQRTNTTGGVPPTDPGSPNEVREVPYTAEYYFYRAE